MTNIDIVESSFSTKRRRVRNREAGASRRTPNTNTLTPTSFSGVFTPHPRGFGFLSPADPSSKIASVFVPPPLCKGLLKGDVVQADVCFENNKWFVLDIADTRRSPSWVFGTAGPTSQQGVVVKDCFGFATLYPQNFDESWPAGEFVFVKTTNQTGAFTDIDPCGMVLSPRHLRRLCFLKAGMGIHPPSFSATAPVPLQRKDLSGLPTFTIDGPYSKDLDDAISAQIEPTGVRVWVHIADVAPYVPEGSVLDEQAFETCTSIYLPSWSRPMLPRELSENKLSLLPGQARETVTVSFLVSPLGQVSDVDVFLSSIVSDVRFTYQSATSMLSAPTGDGTAVGLLAAYQAFKFLQKDRKLRRIMPIGAPSLQWVPTVSPGQQTDPYQDASFVTADPYGSSLADEIIESLMVAANESVATWMGTKNLPVLYRHHPEPAAALLADVVKLHSVLSSAVVSLARSALAAPKEEVNVRVVVREAVELAESDTEKQILLLLWRKHLRKAEYGANPSHCGLGSSAYTHFTSPIRRYADVLVHRVLHAHFANDEAGLNRLRKQLAPASQMVKTLNDRVNAATKIEREFIEGAFHNVAPALLKEKEKGIVTGFSSTAVFVTLLSCGVRVCVNLDDARSDASGLLAHNKKTGNTIFLGDTWWVSVTGTTPSGTLQAVKVKRPTRRSNRSKVTAG